MNNWLTVGGLPSCTVRTASTTPYTAKRSARPRRIRIAPRVALTSLESRAATRARIRFGTAIRRDPKPGRMTTGARVAIASTLHRRPRADTRRRSRRGRTFGSACLQAKFAVSDGDGAAADLDALDLLRRPLHPRI